MRTHWISLGRGAETQPQRSFITMWGLASNSVNSILHSDVSLPFVSGALQYQSVRQPDCQLTFDRHDIAVDNPLRIL